MRTDGSGGDYLKIPGGGSLHPASHETVDQNLHYIRQDGKVVFKYAVKCMADISEDILIKNNILDIANHLLSKFIFQYLSSLK